VLDDFFACRSRAVRGVEEWEFEPKFGFDRLSDDGSEKFMNFMETVSVIIKPPRF
jgi:hypothetical protein